MRSICLHTAFSKRTICFPSAMSLHSSCNLYDFTMIAVARRPQCIRAGCRPSHASKQRQDSSGRAKMRWPQPPYSLADALPSGGKFSTEPRGRRSCKSPKDATPSPCGFGVGSHEAEERTVRVIRSIARFSDPFKPTLTQFLDVPARILGCRGVEGFDR